MSISRSSSSTLRRRPALEAERIHDAAAELDMGVVGLAGAVADPDHVRGGRAPGAGTRGVLARQRLLVAEQQRLVAGVEIGGLQLRMLFEIEPAGLHEGERLGDAVGQFEIALRAARIEIEHPLMHAAEAGVAAVGERAKQIERRGRMAIGLDQPRRIGRARRRGELRPVDDVAAIARQFLAVLLLDRRGARLGELAGDAADLHHRHRGGIGEHHRHLQEHAQEVADVVGADVVGARIGEALGAVAALQQETFALGDAAERLLEVARLAGKHQRRDSSQAAARPSASALLVRVLGHLDDRLASPTVTRPSLGHDATLRCSNFPCRDGAL